eukprot:2054265-Prymnesium_polylepis.1
MPSSPLARAASASRGAHASATRAHENSERLSRCLGPTLKRRKMIDAPTDSKVSSESLTDLQLIAGIRKPSH